MTKRKVIRKSNKTVNLYSWGGESKTAFNKAFSTENLGGTIGGIASSVGTIANAGMQNAQIADTSGIESNIKQTQAYKVQSNTNDDLMKEWSTYSPMDTVNWKDIRGGSTGQRIGNVLSATGSGAATGAMVGGPIGAIVGGVVGLGSSIAGWITGDNKAKKKAKNLNSQINIANSKNLRTLVDKAQSIDTQNDLRAMANFSAFGGPIDMWGYGSGAIGYESANENLDIKSMNALNNSKITSLPNSFNFPELNTDINTFATGGGIHIKPSKRGTFTAAAKRHGKSVQAFASQVLANKEDYSPAMVKKANFAKNASKWHHAFGGNLSTNGADWDNGIIMIGNGGTHEENPMEGVQMGVDPQGIPNLVEEGEVVFNDYVFSNRLMADGGLLESVNLPKSYDNHSFAAIAEKLSKESEERPNDPISQKGLVDSMMKLQQAQETVRQKKQASQEGKKYAYGGKKGKLYSGTGPYTNFLDDVDGGGNIIGYTKNGILMDDGSIATYGSPEYEVASEYGLPERVATRGVAEVTDGTGSNLSWLRYAPVAGNAIGVLQNIFSKPDYTNADAILDAAISASNYTPVGFTPLGNYLKYKPFDRNYYTNKLNAQAGATRRAIMNTTSPARNAALLAADYNTQNALGDLYRKAEEYNLAQRQQVETFNRATNQANAEMGLKAAMANQDAALKAGNIRLSGVSQAMAMRNAIDAAREEGLNASMSGLFESLGGIGEDAYNRADRDMLIKSGVFGTLNQKPLDWSDKRWQDYQKTITGTGYAKGGKLRKKRGGFTY